MQNAIVCVCDRERERERFLTRSLSKSNLVHPWACRWFVGVSDEFSESDRMSGHHDEGLFRMGVTYG
jgi:hypothetical protein